MRAAQSLIFSNSAAVGPQPMAIPLRSLRSSVPHTFHLLMIARWRTRRTDCNRSARRPQSRRPRRCKHYYFYWDDGKFGLTHVRLSSWFPFDVHIVMNGREWLSSTEACVPLRYSDVLGTQFAVARRLGRASPSQIVATCAHGALQIVATRADADRYDQKSLPDGCGFHRPPQECPV